MTRPTCCNHDCQQGDTCPLRAAPEQSKPLLPWRWFLPLWCLFAVLLAVVLAGGIEQ